MANQKLRALLGISNLTTLNQQKKIMNIFYQLSIFLLSSDIDVKFKES